MSTPVTMISCLYHESMFIPWVLFNNNSHFPYHESRYFNTKLRQQQNQHKLQRFFFFYFFLQKYSFKKYGNTNNRNTETEIPQYKLQKNRNISYKNAEIPITKIKPCKLQKYRNTKYSNTNYRITKIKGKQKFTHKSKVTYYLKFIHNSFIKYELWVNLNYGWDLCVNM